MTTPRPSKAAEADKNETSEHEVVSHTSTEDPGTLAQDQDDFKPGDPIQQPEPIAVPTFEDASGVQRIAGGGIRDAWEPAPVEPHPDDVKRAELRQENEKKRAERANKLARGELTNEDAKDRD